MSVRCTGREEIHKYHKVLIILHVAFLCVANSASISRRVDVTLATFVAAQFLLRP
jgi:hypothetical protein